MPEEHIVIRKSARAPSPTLRDVLAVLFRHRRLVLLSFSGVFLSALLYAVFAPSYRAHMTLLVRRRRIDPVVTPTPTTPEFVRPEITDEELNSEVEILRDEELLAKVVEATGLASAGTWWLPGGNGAQVRMARAVRRLARQLNVERVRKTTLIGVSCDAADPALGARVLNALARAYLQKHEEVHRQVGEFRFFDQQMLRYRDELQQAEAQLLAFTGDQGVVSGALERDMALQKLSEVEASYRLGRVAIAETQQRVQALEGKLVSFPERSVTQVRISDNPQLLEKLKSKLLELELQRTDLLTKFEPSYRLVQEVAQQIEETKAAIAVEQGAPLRDETTEKDPNYEWAKAELVKAQVELSALEARNAATARLLTDSYKAARQLGNAAVRQQDLLREMKRAEENYLLYVRKREEARIGDALDERGILNVTLVEPPMAPALPKRSAWTIGLFGLLVAGTVSTGLAFTADFLDPSFRTPSEVASCLEAPVLASLPRRTG